MNSRHTAAPTTDHWPSFRAACDSLSTIDQISTIRAGVASKLLVGAAQSLNVPRERLFEISGVPATTAKRKIANNEMLDALVTERLVRIAQIESRAQEIFGVDGEAQRWLLAPNAALGGLSPLALLDTEPGRQEVTRLLNTLTFGGSA